MAPKIEVLKEEVMLWHKDHLNELSIAQIRKKYKRSYATIVFNFKKYNLEIFKFSDVFKPTLLKEIYSLYLNENLNLKELAKKFNMDAGRLSEHLRKNGYKIRTCEQIHSYNPNHNFFSNIDSEIKAYILGFFAADGHIEKRKVTYCFKVGVHPKDIHILNLINKYIGNDKYKITNKLNRDIVALSICSNQIGLDLLKLGYDNRKTYTTFKLPNIAPNLMNHFIRGYFDGDGSISLNPRFCRNKLGELRPSGHNKQFAIAAYNKSVLEDLLTYLPIDTERAKYYYTETENVCGSKFKATGYTLSIRDTESLKSIYNFLYDNASFYFERKKSIFDKAILSTKDIRQLELQEVIPVEKSCELLET
jgi:hypothetical protein